MSSETLSQNEIDRLLGGSGPAVARRQSAADVQIYDFRRPHRVSKDRLRTLEAMYERLVKGLEAWLIGRVRGQVELKLQSVEQFSFGEFTLSLPTPCASSIFDIRDSGGQQGVIDFAHEFAFFLVDRLFGGGGAAASPDRALTPLERMAVKLVAEKVVTLTQEIWEDYVPLDLWLSGFESFPDILQAASKEDPVLVANIVVKAGSSEGLLLICLPFAVLDRFFATTGKKMSTLAGSAQEQEANRALTEVQVRNARVPVSARLPEFRMSMRDLSRLSVGGVLSTGLARDALISLHVSGQERYRGTAGRVGQSLAVRIQETLDTSADEPSSSPHSTT